MCLFCHYDYILIHRCYQHRLRDRNQIRLRSTLDEISLFLNDNQLAVNQFKTHLIECIISQKQGRTTGTPPSLVVEKEPGVDILENSKYIRIIGANLQGNMLWQSHLETGERALFPQVRK